MNQETHWLWHRHIYERSLILRPKWRDKESRQDGVTEDQGLGLCREREHGHYVTGPEEMAPF